MLTKHMKAILSIGIAGKSSGTRKKCRIHERTQCDVWCISKAFLGGIVIKTLTYTYNALDLEHTNSS